MQFSEDMCYIIQEAFGFGTDKLMNLFLTPQRIQNDLEAIEGCTTGMILQNILHNSDANLMKNRTAIL